MEELQGQDAEGQERLSRNLAAMAQLEQEVAHWRSRTSLADREWSERYQSLTSERAGMPTLLCIHSASDLQEQKRHTLLEDLVRFRLLIPGHQGYLLQVLNCLHSSPSLGVSVCSVGEGPAWAMLSADIFRCCLRVQSYRSSTGRWKKASRPSARLRKQHSRSCAVSGMQAQMSHIVGQGEPTFLRSYLRARKDSQNACYRVQAWYRL